jgi:hypothetical protein
MRNQKGGVSTILIIVIVLIIIAVGGVSWYFISKDDNSDANNQLTLVSLERVFNSNKFTPSFSDSGRLSFTTFLTSEGLVILASTNHPRSNALPGPSVEVDTNSHKWVYGNEGEKIVDNESIFDGTVGTTFDSGFLAFTANGKYEALCYDMGGGNKDICKYMYKEDMESNLLDFHGVINDFLTSEGYKYIGSLF